MRSDIGRLVIEKDARRTADRSRGLGPSLMRFNTQEAAKMTIEDISKLPVLPGAKDLQDEDGNIIFIPGYSEPGGDHIPG